MKITRGDLEITTNVLKKLVEDYGENLNEELPGYDYDLDCPSYYDYQALLDALVIVSNYVVK